ncbi:MAG TPA: hypothetical protein VFP62_05515 [Burkholderiales bacterium]|jgi:hypothetical protein|nr:hypothetical protein [Burkholderiales bacterium]
MDSRFGFQRGLIAVGAALTLLASGCGLMAPKAERYVAPPLGTTWTTSRSDTGSYGSGSGKVAGKRGERTWQGAKMITFEAADGTVVASAEGNWHGVYKGDSPMVTWDPPLGWPWPIEVGKTWTRDQLVTFHAAKRTVPYKLTQKVEAYEDVTVPAGTFKAFKVSTKTSLGDDNLVWFSPDLGIFVKQSLKRAAMHAQGAGTREIELVSYTRGGN